jgi:cytochrome c oxidase assembly protein Cox11
MKSCERQAGMSIPGMLVIAIMVGFFVMCAIRMVPRYVEYLSVREIITTIAREHKIEEENIRDIRRRIETMFNTNQIYDLKPKDVEVYRKDGETFIDATYEVRIPIMGNIDAVMHFDDLVYVAGNKLL